MYQYCYEHTMNEIAVYLRVEGMKALLWHIKRITPCKHHTPEQVRLPFHTAKSSQGTIHYTGIKNMVQLCRRPASSRFCPLISLIRKTQLLLQVLIYPLSQLGGQPTQDWMSSPVKATVLIFLIWVC